MVQIMIIIIIIIINFICIAPFIHRLQLNVLYILKDSTQSGTFNTTLKETFKK
jgi:hypothetical protein